MANDINNSKLDKAIKQALGNYEAPYDATDWAKMESMLDAAPKSSSFKWSYSLNIFIGLMVLGGLYAVVHSLSASKTEDSNNSEIQNSIENKVEVIAKPIAIPSTPAAPASVPAKSIAIPETNVTETLETKTEKSIKENVAAAENIKNPVSENQVKKSEEKKTIKPPQVINNMGNEPVFGDMLDSSKGIVGKTKEKEKTKKAALSQPDNSIGWSSFLLKNNLDSLKKYHQQQQKDSLKK